MLYLRLVLNGMFKSMNLSSIKESRIIQAFEHLFKVIFLLKCKTKILGK